MTRHRVLPRAAALLAALVCGSARTAALDLRSAVDAGWQEAVISTANPQPLLDFFTRVAGWRVTASQAMPPATRRFYLGEAAPAPDPAPREWLVTDAEGAPGFVRLVAIGAPRATPIRASAMAWDTGGIMSLMTRSNATASVQRAAERLGWGALNDPVELNLTDSGVKLTNVVLRGPEGVLVSVYERLVPRTPDAPDLQRLRRPFNSMQSVRDVAAARRFYVDVLGFEVVNAGDFVNAARAPNNFGVPANLSAANPIRFLIVGPRKTGPTQVEIVEFIGVEGRDLAPRASPAGLGIVALRFPVSSLAAVRGRLVAARWPLERPPTELVISPYGAVRMLAVRSPEGARLEFFERVQR